MSRSIPNTGRPSPERNRYSNKEAVKVNAGLHFGGPNHDDEDDEVANPFNTNASAVAIDFSLLVAPTVTTEAPLTTTQLVDRLLHPPPHAFVHGALSMQWVIGAIGMDHVSFRQNDERYVLAEHSALRREGSKLGLPALYMEWLSGDDEQVISTDLGVYLTPRFFTEL
ncbi:hypothetical protein BKA66DRAFT_413198 [Pyrenochaeta sp. MPI-SDFR-AT-0127]|nr:hypothetical protein BKA66DRAFT_413198 [Pyrenochaeta sp. MPI-SDFR-AT-0127]